MTGNFKLRIANSEFIQRSTFITLNCLLLIMVAAAVSAHDPREQPPRLGAPPALKLPAIQKRTLSNGLRVWMIESHEVPLAQVNLVILSGGAADPAGKFGVASLTAAMLDEGAGSRAALAIADALEGLGASLTTASSFDASAIRMNVPTARLKEALAIMADIALRPAFPARDLERLRQERLTSLLQARDEPSSIASTAFARLLYGPVHRYGTNGIGTEETVRAFTVADLQAFHAAHYVPANAALIVTGDLTPDTAMRMLEAEFGQWNGAAPKAPSLPPAPPPMKRRLVLVDKPGAAQSQIRIGGIGAPRSTPDYHPLEVMNTVLGGSFTSRLNSNLREQHGYTYGASSYFDMRRGAGPFIAGAGVQTDKTADAVREFFVELNGMMKPIPADELKKARNYLALGFPGEFETTGELSRKLEDLVVYGLLDDTFNQYTRRVQAVTSAAARQAAGKYIVPSRFLVVVVGDRKVVEPGLRALNLGPVENMTVDEAMDKR